ncbi:MAG: biotin transporter BioY [Rhizobiaceae bacterium]|nr:biotin transporter BioY [Rhizobiaceae bacterium]
MSTITHAHKTLADTLWSNDSSLLRHVTLAVVGSIALWISAKIQVPFYPVPMTMQTFVVLVIGMAFGWRLGAATLALYVAEGAMGLPVFAGTPEKGLGLAYMVGPTGGYLLGFLVAAATVGWLAEKGWGRNVGLTLAAMAIGTAIILAFGNAWLGAIIGWDKPVLQFGLYPFLPGAAFKIALAALLMPAIWKFASPKGK